MVNGLFDVVLQPWFFPSMTVLALLILMAVFMIPVTIFLLRAFPKTTRLGIDETYDDGYNKGFCDGFEKGVKEVKKE